MPRPATLARRVDEALEHSGLAAAIILARKDATAIAAEVEWRKVKGRPEPIWVESDSHTFARPGDREALLAACLQAVARISA